MSNYTEAMESELRDLAMETGEFTYDMAVKYAAEKGLKHRSVIAKVKSLGLNYKVKEVRVTKTGEAVVRKSELVAAVEAALGVSVGSLVKASKADLQVLADALQR